jgi:hypothetical protein
VCQRESENIKCVGWAVPLGEGARERERERDRQTERERERDAKRERSIGHKLERKK